ncbi:MAG: DNA recombination protein RmuC [Gammaproteobacteria bacterium]|nr:MAG: DNA recombination protein RmuC [Gammaproteobacteria bacterium]
MALAQFKGWLLSHPIEAIIILAFLGFVFLLLFSFGRLKGHLGEQKDRLYRFQQQLDNDNDQLKIELGKLSQSLSLRSEQLAHLSQQQHQQFRQESELQKNTVTQALGQLTDNLHQQHHRLRETHHHSLLALQKIIAEQLKSQTEQVRHTVDSLNKTTENRLKDITGHVNRQLEQGFNKTQTTFTDIQKRLSIIDEAQKRIDHLSTNVVSLQNVLTDKKTRGAFGEMQLQTIVENALPPQFVNFQYTLSNNKRADCIIHLPEPNGDIVIDAKFPLESYRQLVDEKQETTVTITQNFKKDIKKHITDIADKYIHPPETAESAILFIPAEAIFAEIHANHSDLVEFAQRHQVWLTSPTTLMAILATAKSVIKDDATRRQAHIMREQLHRLRLDFERFQNRMDNLAKHIDQANRDVAEVNTSATKISKHFRQIEATDEWTKPVFLHSSAGQNEAENGDNYTLTSTDNTAKE